ncbi:hypothetical protein WISP_114132 [Willisornis vidua]|uniref:Uncharacterized protein n=1 Tax=Willisornis vidua TaxID=1566151 RepID=A0ABQ9CZJ7_9PASS|nr:hypothetical protein WISP_114132 [Willisornis vidua]
MRQLREAVLPVSLDHLRIRLRLLPYMYSQMPIQGRQCGMSMVMQDLDDTERLASPSPDICHPYPPLRVTHPEKGLLMADGQ